MIPLLHDLAGETVLVFGGGAVGARRARRFASEARVVVVSPAFADEPFGGAERVRAAPAAPDVAGWLDRVEPAVVVAATDDPAVNAAVERAATDRNVLVNRADERGSRPAGSVVVPATVRDGPVTVSVATDATAPALSRVLRVRLEPAVAAGARVAAALSAVEADLRGAGVPDDARREALRAVASSSAVWAAARTDGDVEAVAGREATAAGPTDTP